MSCENKSEFKFRTPFNISKTVCEAPIRGYKKSKHRILEHLVARKLLRLGVKAIIFEINSPGGTVVGSRDISAEIEACSKPTVAWLREVAASGAYWIAASTDRIVADPATITGSIGVTGSFLEFSKLMEKYGITYESITSGPYKDLGSPYKETTEEERLLLQKKINAIKDMFVEHISESRGMSVSKVTGLATGEIFLGTEAYENGLVDVLGSKQEALAVAEELAGEKLTLFRYSIKKSLLERLTQAIASSAYFIGRGFGDSFRIRDELMLR